MATEPAPAPKKETPKLSEHAQAIIKMTRDTEFLQSFLRVDLGTDSDPEEPGARPRTLRKAPEEPSPVPPPPVATPVPSAPTGAGEAATSDRERVRKPHTASVASGVVKKGATTFSQLTRDMKLRKAPRRGRGKRRAAEHRQEEVYTDKDRAAAVNMGSRDIKHSLKMKRRQDRSQALQIPEEAEPSSLLALGSHEMRNGDIAIAITFMHKALELNPNDKNALVARSKCYLLLGQPQLALQDAETALCSDKSFIRAIFQKAESLYHLGDFEHSLMYYHRGQRLRPELEGFRLGVQKAQEAIENTIGSKTIGPCIPLESLPRIEEPAPMVKLPAAAAHVASSEKRVGSSRSRPPSAASRRQARHLLGELCVDKDYLEQLLRHPDIKCPHQEAASHIASHAEEGVAFLNNRQEFWRQQRPTNTGNKKEKKLQKNRSHWVH